MVIGHINITLKFYKTVKYDYEKQNHTVLHHRADRSERCHGAIIRVELKH